MESNCQLQNLEGVKEKLVNAVLFKKPSKIALILKEKMAATAAGSNGAINIWRDDSGIIRGGHSRYCIRQEERTFKSIAAVIVWAKQKLEEIA